MNKQHGLLLLSLLGLGAVGSVVLTSASQRSYPTSSSSEPSVSPPTQQESQDTMTPTLNAANASISSDQLTQLEQMLMIPAGFALATSQPVAMNGEAVWHLRYERADQQNRGLHGEHFSAVISQQDGRLQGVTHMIATLSDGPLPDEAEAQSAAIAYLENQAPDLLDSMEIQWIKPHDEQIQVLSETAAAQTVTITGMKVKCYNPADGRYFWVIVGPQDQIITFERDIVWSTNMGQRQTEKWLHDQWLAEQQLTSRQVGDRHPLS